MAGTDWIKIINRNERKKSMVTIAYIGFGVSVREYHIPYVENRDDAKVKYVYRREEDIAQFAEYEPFYPEIIFTTDLDQVLSDEEVNVTMENIITELEKILGAELRK